jgi:hypothetical protein
MGKMDSPQHVKFEKREKSGMKSLAGEPKQAIG